MEFEGLSENLEWQARRVAAAFGVKEWTHELYVGDYVSLVKCQGYVGDSLVEWDIECRGSGLDNVQIGQWREPYDGCSIANGGSSKWVCEPHPKYNSLMARGLYRLGLEDEYVLAELPPLSAHEKLELRHSMPREFWPQRWLEEEQERP